MHDEIASSDRASGRLFFKYVNIMKIAYICSLVVILGGGGWLYVEWTDRTTATADVGAGGNLTGDSRNVPGLARQQLSEAANRPSSWRHAPRVNSGRMGEAWELSQELRKALMSPDAASGEPLASELLSRLLNIAPEHAARIAESIEPEDGRDQILLRVAQGWGSRDVSAALAWASGLSDEGERHDALVEISLEAANRDPSAAADIALEYGLDGESPSILPLLCQIWAEDNIRGVLSWSEKHAERLPHDEVVARIAFVQAQTEPAEAARLVAMQIEPGTVQDEAVMAVLHQWALRDPDEPLRWVERFSDGPLKERALAELHGVQAETEW